MRNYSSTVSTNKVLAIDTGVSGSTIAVGIQYILEAFECDMSICNIFTDSYNDYIFDDEEGSIEEIRYIASRFGDKYLTSSESGTLMEFFDWLETIRDKEACNNLCPNGSFVYCNVNTGETLVFIAWYGYEDYALTHLDSL